MREWSLLNTMAKSREVEARVGRGSVGVKNWGRLHFHLEDMKTQFTNSLSLVRHARRTRVLWHVAEEFSLRSLCIPSSVSKSVSCLAV